MAKKTEKELIRAIRKVQCFGISRESTETILERVNNPEWKQREKVHDWRNHVDHELRSLWTTLTLETRLAITLTAILHAADEEWA